MERRKGSHNVFDRFTPLLQRVLASAAKIAQSQGKTTIDPVHLFYGLTTQPELMTTRFFSPAPSSLEGGKKNTRSVSKKPMTLAPTTQRIIDYAIQLADTYQHGSIGTQHLFTSLLSSRHQGLKKILHEQPMDVHELEDYMYASLEQADSTPDFVDTFLEQPSSNPQELPKDPKSAPQKAKQQSALEYFSIHLTDPAYATRLDPLIGREEELSRLIRVLARRTKNNPLLLGSPGVGKTAIVEGLAKNIVLGAVPDILRDKKIYALNITSVVAGSTFRGELEMRMKQLIDEVKNRPEVILFVDEVHNIVGAGSSTGSMDVSNILKPALARGELRCIGATTFSEYKKYIEEDPALERRFQSIMVNPPSTEESEKIIAGIAPFYEQHHGVTITSDAIRAAVNMSNRYMTEKFLPDKAIDIIDEAAAKARIENTTTQTLEINPEQIAHIVSSLTGIPLKNLVRSEKQRLINLEQELSQRVIGQTSAKRIVASYLRRAKSGLTAKNRPLASFAFLGPSGVGKTELARAIADIIIGPDGLIKLDMSEFSESFTVSRLVGAPSGYIGFKEGGKLTESIRRQPYSVVLFDEIEKAHPKVANILLQILEDGCLTDAAGKKIDFSNTIIILTSNIGAKHYTTMSEMGFATQANDNQSRLKEYLVKDMKEWFNPELVNRLDQVIVFDALTAIDLEAMIEKRLNELAEKLEDQGVTLKLTPKAKKHLASIASDPAQGGRAVRHSIEDHLETIIADALLNQPDDSPPATLTIDSESEKFRAAIKQTKKKRTI